MEEIKSSIKCLAFTYKVDTPLDKPLEPYNKIVFWIDENLTPHLCLLKNSELIPEFVVIEHPDLNVEIYDIGKYSISMKPLNLPSLLPEKL